MTTLAPGSAALIHFMELILESNEKIDCLMLVLTLEKWSFMYPEVSELLMKLNFEIIQSETEDTNAIVKPPTQDDPEKKQQISSLLTGVLLLE